jgi:hypothetical protein
VARNTPKASRRNRLAAVQTSVRVDPLRLAERGVACPRAKANVAALTRDEGDSALVADVGTAREAASGIGCALERFSALVARPADSAVREGRACASEHFGVLTPEGVVGLRVATTAVDDEIRELVCLLVASEDAERDDVMDGQIARRSASLACPTVALVAGASGGRPRRSSVSLVSSAPCGVERSGPGAWHEQILPKGVDG